MTGSYPRPPRRVRLRASWHALTDAARPAATGASLLGTVLIAGIVPIGARWFASAAGSLGPGPSCTVEHAPRRRARLSGRLRAAAEEAVSADARLRAE